MSLKKGLRPRKEESVAQDEVMYSSDEEEDAGAFDDDGSGKKKKNQKNKSVAQSKRPYKKRQTSEEEDDNLPSNEADVVGASQQDDEEDALDRLPKTKKGLVNLLCDLDKRIVHYKQLFFKEQNDIASGKKSLIPDNSIPICSDVTQFNFNELRDSQMRHCGKMFDVIMMDPPWQLSTSQPSRGVAIAYDSLCDDKILSMPIEKLQQNGFIFVWAINARYRFTCKLIEKWGYKLVDEITWVKKTVNGKIAKGHGFYLQHAKESCLIGVKGDVENGRFKKNIASDVIFSERRGQSQKPEEIYQYINELSPNGHFLEIFARRNNLHSNWVSIGNEL